jgi:hypothetical protein
MIMSNTKLSKSVLSGQTVESVVEEIKALLNGADCLVLVGTADAEAGGVIEEGDEIWREIIPLGLGTHIIMTVNLPTKLGTGIHEV